MTYNQSAFICDTMNGFVLQKTDFPFVCTIIDDASTDGEPDVIERYVRENFDFTEPMAFCREEEYGRLFYARHKENKNCYFAVLLLKENHFHRWQLKMSYIREWRDHVDYEALCEGDDFWTGSDKLQRQVAFLDAHPEYTLTFHDAMLRYEDGSKKERVFANLETREYCPEEMILTWKNPTASMVYRMKYSDYYTVMDYDPEKEVFGDSILKLTLLHFGKAYAFKDVWSVYRIHNGSISYRYSTETWHKMLEQYIYCQEKFPEFRDILKTPISEMYFSQGKLTLIRKDFWGAMKFFRLSITTSLTAFIKQAHRMMVGIFH